MALKSENKWKAFVLCFPGISFDFSSLEVGFSLHNEQITVWLSVITFCMLFRSSLRASPAVRHTQSCAAALPGTLSCVCQFPGGANALQRLAHQTDERDPGGHQGAQALCLGAILFGKGPGDTEEWAESFEKSCLSQLCVHFCLDQRTLPGKLNLRGSLSCTSAPLKDKREAFCLLMYIGMKCKVFGEIIHMLWYRVPCSREPLC